MVQTVLAIRRIQKILLKGFAVSMLLVLGFATSGCGYALAGRGAFMPEYINVVGIPPLVNNSTFFQVEQLLTEKIRTEFIGRGRYTVISTPEGADAVVTGAVTSVTVQPVGFTEQQLASRYLFTLTMRVEFTDGTGKHGEEGGDPKEWS